MLGIKLVTCVFSVGTHFEIRRDDDGAEVGGPETLSQDVTGCISCLRAASVKAALPNCVLRRFDMGARTEFDERVDASGELNSLSHIIHFEQVHTTLAVDT